MQSIIYSLFHYTTCVYVLLYHKGKENKRKKVNSPPSKLFPGIFLLTNLFERFIIAPTRKTVEKEE